MNTDELLNQMEHDDLEDATKLTPREYARLRKLESPQIVYYYIRTGKLNLENCICGRKVLDVKLADEFFNAKAEKERSRQGLPTTSTE